ncbi:hypothetical protein D3C86_1118950 [compost metagenome]
MKSVLTMLSGVLAIALAALGLWFSYIEPTIEDGFRWVYLQLIIYAVFLLPSLIPLSISLLGKKSRRLAMVAAVILAINAVAFVATPFLMTPM